MTALVQTKPHIRRRLDGSSEIVYRARGPVQEKAATQLHQVSAYQRFWGLILESYPGAWQQNVEVLSSRDLLSYPPIYAAVTLIAGDIAKLRLRMMTYTESKLDPAISVWKEIPKSPLAFVLRKPTHFQTQYQWITAWVVSRLLYGNTYILKERDARGVVRRGYILDPRLVLPLVSESSEVFYELRTDYLSGIDVPSVTVPASEIGHDRVTPLWHPLVGVSPLYAAALAGTQGVAIQQNSANFFANMSRPSGVLTAPGAISNETAERVKTLWEERFSGTNAGKTAVLGDGLKYEPMTIPADQSQQPEQADQAALWVAMAFKIPPYKLGLRSNVTFSNMAQLDLDYYKSCLGTHIESIETTFDDFAELDPWNRSEFDLAALFRMDPLTRAQIDRERLRGGSISPNEVRIEEGYEPVDGGEEPLTQQQNYPLSVLKKRPPPDGTPSPGSPPPQDEEAEAKTADVAGAKDFADALIAKFLDPEVVA